MKICTGCPLEEFLSEAAWELRSCDNNHPTGCPAYDLLEQINNKLTAILAYQDHSLPMPNTDD